MLVGRVPLFNGHVRRDIFFFARSSYLFVLVFISSTAFVQSIRISWSSTRDTPLRRVLIRENATPSLAHLIVRHAIAPCHCLRLSSTPIAWHAITPCSPSLSSSFIVVIAAKPRNLLVFLHRHGRMVSGRRSRRLLIIISCFLRKMLRHHR